MAKELTSLNQRILAVMRQGAMMRREHVDFNHARAIMLGSDEKTAKGQITEIFAEMGFAKLSWKKKPDQARLPQFVLFPDGELALVKGRLSDGNWLVSRVNFETRQMDEVEISSFEKRTKFAQPNFVTPFFVRKSNSMKLIRAEIFRHKFIISEIIIVSLVIAFLALATSLYAMQVYDRVLPTSAYSTLLVLSTGIAIALLLDFIGKWVRNNLLHHISNEVDQNLARSAFSRFLGVRLDKMPQSVGSMAQNIHQYEQVRGFLVAALTFFFVDLPLVLIFLVVFTSIGQILVSAPIFYVVTALIIGLITRGRIQYWIKAGAGVQNQKMGHLVESMQSAETIKSGNGGWRMLARWLDVTDRSRYYDEKSMNISERSQMLMGFLQQGTYILIIALGSILVGQGEMTMGGLIACSILGSRIMSPISQIPNLITRWGYTRSAVSSLDNLWALEQDHQGDQLPVHLEQLYGNYDLKEVQVNYNGTRAIKIENLIIRAGERIVILGTIGSGKTTLLKTLGGLFHADEGEILLEDVALNRISREVLTDNIGYVSQDGTLIGGTLRENLLLGLVDPGDEAILSVAKKTGLYASVIKTHSDGLDRIIQEGGSGLSGGQKQLVLLTRAFLRKPNIWLLDEPTASVDTGLEGSILKALNSVSKGEDKVTFIIATHRPQLLELADRVIVLANGFVQLDGPKHEVLARLREKAKPAKVVQAVRA